ncbi:MAG: hypothetical protein D6677_05450 [Calditrichaeota bacterium]|nr:MAG: hypothetical protein D6677_05450 [Calditrichota bacterium]
MRMIKSKFLWIAAVLLIISCSEQPEAETPDVTLQALSELITINALKVSDTSKQLLVQKTFRKYKISASQMYSYLNKNMDNEIFWRQQAMRIRELIKAKQEEALDKKAPKPASSTQDAP